MGYALRETPVLGNSNIAYARQNMEMVRNSKTEIQIRLAKAG
jgi:hypothetical protein